MIKLWTSIFIALIVGAFAQPSLADPAGSSTGGTAGTQSWQDGCVYNSAPPTLSTGQQVAVQCDVNGNMKIGGTITASNPSVSATGSAVPASGTYAAGNKSGTLTGVTLDGSSNLNVNCAVGCSAATLGNGTAAAAARVTIASDSTGTVLVTQPTAANLNATITGAVTIPANSSVNLTQIVGAAPSLTNPLWAAYAEAADSTGTFTNATQTNSITAANVDGYPTALVSINGTYGTGTGVFEASDDSGVTFYSVACTRSDNTAVETGYTSLTNTNRQWVCPTAGNDSFRIRSTAVASGTINGRISISAAPTTPNSVGGALTGSTSNAGSAVATSSTNLPTVSYLYGFNGTTWDQILVDGTKKLFVDINNASPFSNASDAVATSSNVIITGLSYPYMFNGTTWDRVRSISATTNSTGTGLAAVGGTAELDDTSTAAVSENQFGPLRMGAQKQLLTQPLSLAPYSPALGAQATQESCSSGNVANATVACTLATAATTKTYIAGFVMTSNGATAAAAVTCTLTGTITGTMSFTYIYGAVASITNQPLTVQFNPPIPASAINTTIVASCPASGTGGTNAAMSAWGYQQ